MRLSSDRYNFQIKDRSYNNLVIGILAKSIRNLAYFLYYIDAREYKSRKSKFHFFQEKQKMNSFG